MRGWQMAIFAAAVWTASTLRAGLPTISCDPCIGWAVMDAASGRLLAEANADAAVYPASVVKLMTLLTVLDRVDDGAVRLSDPVRITAEAVQTGGSRVELKMGERFTVDDLIYALMLKSANDAAVALAVHAAGSQAAFVELMNRRAQDLGMVRTRFYTCHGLPPSPPRTDTEVDVSTPRDLAVLSRALVLHHPEALRYTATRERVFRRGAPPLHNHDMLLGAVPGVDGLKTGWFVAGGYSIAATARRDGRRVIAVVAGSRQRLVRDRAAADALELGFARLPPLAAPRPPSPAREPISLRAMAIGVGAVLVAILVIVLSFRPGRRIGDGYRFVEKPKRKPRP